MGVSKMGAALAVVAKPAVPLGVVERKELQRVSELESDGAVRSMTLSMALLMVSTCETG